MQKKKNNFLYMLLYKNIINENNIKSEKKT
jgi:hypothetical protein